MLSVVHDDGSSGDHGGDDSPVIEELVREDARRMLAEALQAEVDDYIARFVDQRDEHGRRLVVRNGSPPRREVLTSARAIEMSAPQVNDKRVDPDTGQRKRFSSAILPPWARKTPKITEVLPLLYLPGLSSGDFLPMLGQFLGSSKGLSSSVITKLTEQWKAEQRAFSERDLSEVDFVYVWADGIHVNIRLEEHTLCLLVLLGVRADGRKELIIRTDGYRESAESWADLLRDAKRRGMRAQRWRSATARSGSGARCAKSSPTPASSAAGSARPEICSPRCPNRPLRGRRKPWPRIWGAEDRDHVRQAVKTFEATYGAKVPEAVAKITDDVDQLLAFYAYPAQHWVHLRTANPIESTFATVRHRTKVTKRPGSRAAGLAMAFKLVESAQTRWRAVNARHLVALGRAGARFVNGELVERPDDHAPPISRLTDLDPQVLTISPRPTRTRYDRPAWRACAVRTPPRSGRPVPAPRRGCRLVRRIEPGSPARPGG